MVDVQAALDRAGLKNVHVREYVRHWAEHTGAERIEVISASDDARLVGEALADGEILPAGEGRYYSRSYVKDTARSEERTVVATSNPADKGVYNNWRPAGEMRPLVEKRMRGASAGQYSMRSKPTTRRSRATRRRIRSDSLQVRPPGSGVPTPEMTPGSSASRSKVM